jgi:hypothetical protein
MAWAIPQYSRAQIDKAGETLVNSPAIISTAAEHDDIDSALEGAAPAVVES